MKKWTFGSLFSGLGGGSKGFIDAGWECLFALDSDAEACADHGYLTGHRTGPVDIEALMPEDLRLMCPERPDAILTSPPCKGYSGCLPAKMSKAEKYVQLNSLAMLGVWLTLEAWDEPPPLILLENVPRIQTRGREWLDHIQAMLRTYDYSCRETKHDCGEFGGLAQHRDRFLLVARHMPQVGEFLHEPPRKRVRGIGEVVGELPVPLPDDDAGGPLHRLPKLAPINWVRLALIPSGGDWRDLPEQVALSPRSGRQNGGFGVEDWAEPGHTVVAEGSVRNTRGSVADPRVECSPRATVYGVADGNEPSGTVLASASHDNGPFSVADPRVNCTRREGGHGVVRWDEASCPVIGEATIHNWPAALADPRVNDNGRYRGGHGVLKWDDPAAVIRGSHEVRLAPASVSDPRLNHDTRRGNFHVHRWAEPSHVVIGDARTYKGANVADPRVPTIVGPELGDLEADKRPTHIIIRAADGMWHRPMTTLELAVLQGFPARHNGDWLQLAGGSHKRYRQRIGNAIPPPTAEAIARAMADVLETAESGEYRLCGEPVWVDGEEKGVSA